MPPTHSRLSPLLGAELVRALGGQVEEETKHGRHDEVAAEAQLVHHALEPVAVAGVQHDGGMVEEKGREERAFALGVEGEGRVGHKAWGELGWRKIGWGYIYGACVFPRSID